MEEEKTSVKISVRTLVEFVMRSGDLDNRRMGAAEKDAMQAGSRIHRKIQKRMGADYQAEVPMKHVVEEGEDHSSLVKDMCIYVQKSKKFTTNKVATLSLNMATWILPLLVNK